jgi:hypothetical protein
MASARPATSTRPPGDERTAFTRVAPFGRWWKRGGSAGGRDQPGLPQQQAPRAHRRKRATAPLDADRRVVANCRAAGVLVEASWPLLPGQAATRRRAVRASEDDHPRRRAPPDWHGGADVARRADRSRGLPRLCRPGARPGTDDRATSWSWTTCPATREPMCAS